jgi:hypothetical protein
LDKQVTPAILGLGSSERGNTRADRSSRSSKNHDGDLRQASEPTEVFRGVLLRYPAVV